MDTLRRVVSRSSVQAIVTLAIVGTFCWGFASGLIAAEMFATQAAVVIAFWFAKEIAKP